MYRVTFEVKDKMYELIAKSVDLTNHPFLMVVEDFEFEDNATLIISPNGNETRKRFNDVKRIYVPMQSLKLLEEISNTIAKVSPIKVAE